MAEDLFEFRKQEKSLIKIMGDGLPQLKFKTSRRMQEDSYASKDISCGEKVSSKNLIALRPLKGISAEDVESIYGEKFNKSKQKGE